MAKLGRDGTAGSSTGGSRASIASGSKGMSTGKAKVFAKKVVTKITKNTAPKEAMASKAAARANARGLKAANKPTKASKTFLGDNSKIGVEVRRGVLKREKPANPNVTRGGGMATLKRQQAEARKAAAARGADKAIAAIRKRAI